MENSKELLSKNIGISNAYFNKYLSLLNLNTKTTSQIVKDLIIDSSILNNQLTSTDSFIKTIKGQFSLLSSNTNTASKAQIKKDSVMTFSINGCDSFNYITNTALSFLTSHGFSQVSSRTTKFYYQTEKERLLNVQDEKDNHKKFSYLHHNHIEEKVKNEEEDEEEAVDIIKSLHSEYKNDSPSKSNIKKKGKGKFLGNKRKKVKEENEHDLVDEYCKEDCLFERKDCNQRMIYCEGKCGIWYHLECINMSDEKMNEYENKNWYCNTCIKK